MPKTQDKIQSRGITLIVLIITIILLIILAGVVVSTITLDKMPFDKINGIAGQYNNTVEKHQEAVNKIINEMNEDYITDNSKNEMPPVIDVPKDDDKITKTISEMVNERTIKVGDWIDYPIELGRNTLLDENEMPTGEYNIMTTQTGYSSVQTYNVKNYTGGWRVLYVDNSTGTVEIVSTDNILSGDTKNTLTFYGRVGFNNIISTLNTACGYYVNEKYAERGRSAGSNRTNPSNGDSSLQDHSILKDIGCNSPAWLAHTYTSVGTVATLYDVFYVSSTTARLY